MSDPNPQPNPIRHGFEYEKAELDRVVLDNVPVIFARADAGLRYEWIYNPHPDFDPAAVIGKRDDELDSGPGIDALVKLKQSVLIQGVQIRERITFERSDGRRTYDIIATPTRDDAGQVTHVATVSIDITEAIQVEEALRESERQQRELVKSLKTEQERLATVLENLPVGVWIADQKGRLISKNKQSDAIWMGDAPLSTSIDEYLQYDAWYAHNGQRLQPEEYPVAQVLQTGEPVDPVELQIRRFDGTEGTILVSAVPIKDSQNVITGAVGINVDITARKQAEEDLRQMNDSLEEQVEERSREVRSLVTQLTMSEQSERRRISGILHDDLQQRLYGLLFQLAVLRRSLGDREWESVPGMVDEIEEALKVAVQMTRNLSVDLSPPILYNEGLVEAIGWLTNQMQQQHGLSVKVQAEADLPVFNEDLRVLLFQSVRELLFNVIKHAGVLHAHISLTMADGLLCIEVRDQGAGFDADVMIDRSVRSNGLLQVGRRLELVGGHLEIESDPAHGTRAILYCPLSRKIE
jgi:two-component system, chemotaxis family, CheB/CheR fusion protein